MAEVKNSEFIIPIPVSPTDIVSDPDDDTVLYKSKELSRESGYQKA